MQLNPQTTSEQQLTSTTLPTQTIILDVGGMKCAGCVMAVERQLNQQQGVIAVRVNLATEVATVECEPGTVDPQKLADILTETGFNSQLRYGSAAHQKLTFEERHRQEMRDQIGRVIICGVLIFLSGIGHFHHIAWGGLPLVSSIWFHWGLATLALLFPGRSLIVDGVRSLARNAPNMNTLVGLGTISAYTASLVALLFPRLGWECFFDEPVMLLGFILLGKTLEQQARIRAARAFEALWGLQPTTAQVILSTQLPELTQENSAIAWSSPTVEVPAEQVRVGDLVKVFPGEKIPVDGRVIMGSSTVDESMLTGESFPVTKQRDLMVFAGTLNQSGGLIIAATRTGEETTVAQIISLVETAQTRKAPIQFLADKVAGYFTYLVMGLATLTLIFWYTIGTKIWPEVMTSGGVNLAVDAPLLLSLKLAIAVLVIACPCALGLATPTAILVGSAIGAERGILIKGGDILERVHQLHTVVFDKTGTLTTASPQVTTCVSLSHGFSDDRILQLAAAVEQGTHHPIATAICRALEGRNLPIIDAEGFVTQTGLGAAAMVDGERVWVGSAEGLSGCGVILSESVLSIIPPGETVVYVTVGDELVGVIGICDRLKSDAKMTVERLQKMGLNVVLLTGDRFSVAEAIASELQLSEGSVLAEVRPEDKAKAIAAYQQQGHRVAMVGDGINDAPALAQADVAIALGTGTDVAIETADIVLMGDALGDVVESIRLSQQTFNKIRQNLFWAFAYNTIGLPMAAGVLLPGFGIVFSPSVAAAFMAFSSVSVVTNSLLLRRQFTPADFPPSIKSQPE
ncbi:MAG: heavy metal translocating P-type ATPase [Limnospira sp. PMC 1291.21]|uniref:Copper transporter n=3 Tax=Limnospira TaxID=2596745 RepID=A0A9P1NWT6_9CYAN|nr:MULTISPECIES: heavy metal translocating P-type ATPase [Limnospira]SPD79482.1 Copper transporter [Arthrospira platensis]MDT9180157.1 heavy metal translocating P-type ATPase [Limnospira sp. PMC 1238.20]MDT9195429.1 heavy metal translocating P-type ATPase [Limnospira sp. PMC 1245.20]MDT9205604.1 heavy metal translocating P-type ATPase [Limnospira sp. PMC 1243.20]MDT9210718.1 heavy metal translocating P-type ATPase [Limnospira sp. PMC 1252.20]